MENIARVVCADAVDFMSALPDRAFKLIVTDPPYDEWERDVVDASPYFEQMFRVSDNQIIGGVEHLWQYLPRTGSFVVLSYAGAWPLWFWTSFDRQSQTINVTNHKEDIDLFPGRRDVETRVHLVEAIEKLIVRYSEPADTILDPFGGTGTTLLAANRSRRVSVGVDRNSNRVAIMRGRL